MVKQISDNEIYLLIKHIKSVLWRVAKRLSYIEDARCLKVNIVHTVHYVHTLFCLQLNQQCTICHTPNHAGLILQRVLVIATIFREYPPNC